MGAAVRRSHDHHLREFMSEAGPRRVADAQDEVGPLRAVGRFVRPESVLSRSWRWNGPLPSRCALGPSPEARGAEVTFSPSAPLKEY
jgi:hypothetical protein